MRKFQDVQTLADDPTPEGKFRIAADGRKAISGAADAIRLFQNIDMLTFLREKKFILKAVVTKMKGKPDETELAYGPPEPRQLLDIGKEYGSLDMFYAKKISEAKEQLADLVCKALEKRNAEMFAHLADTCGRSAPATVADTAFNQQLTGKESEATVDRSTTSPAEYAILSLQHAHAKTWPRVPMSRTALMLYLSKAGIAIDETPLSRSIKRTGIILTVKEKVGRK